MGLDEQLRCGFVRSCCRSVVCGACVWVDILSEVQSLICICPPVDRCAVHVRDKARGFQLWCGMPFWCRRVLSFALGAHGRPRAQRSITFVCYCYCYRYCYMVQDLPEHPEGGVTAKELLPQALDIC